MAQYNYITGTVHWAKVLGDPVPNYTRDGREWTLDLTPDDDGYALIKKLGISSKIKNKGDERENFIQFKQREFRADGTRNKPLPVYDARNQLWDPETKIGNKSTVEVKFNVVDYGKGKPQGVYPQAVRVLELVPYVRQEFAPLPEDSKYYQNFAEDAGDYEGEDAPIEGDPLDG